MKHQLRVFAQRVQLDLGPLCCIARSSLAQSSSTLGASTASGATLTIDTASLTTSGNAVGSFKRSDCGMKYALPAVGDVVTLNIEFEGDKE